MIAVDACLSDKEEIGTIKTMNEGLIPEASVGRDFSEVGNIAIKGVVAVKGIIGRIEIQNKITETIREKHVLFFCGHFYWK